jgi:hypothetical protein
MSGPGDIDGEVSGEEAAWRDLIARFDVPDDRTGAGAPWPASEDLPDGPGSKADALEPDPSASATPDPSSHESGGQAARDRSVADDGPARAPDAQGPADRQSASPADRPADRQSASPADRPTDRQSASPADRPTDRQSASPADRPADRQSASPADRPADRQSASPPERQSASPADRQSTGREDRQSASPADRQSTGPADRPGRSDSGSRPDQVPGPGSHPAIGFAVPTDGYFIPTDRTRVIRPAGDPRSYTPADEQDEPYVPEPLPPPAKLDSMTKAALVGVIGGPGYLLIASIFMHWTISAEAALLAVAAFVGGFVTLVIKLGDRSGHDDDDDGAVL